jgi:hypothetical protein
MVIQAGKGRSKWFKSGPDRAVWLSEIDENRRKLQEFAQKVAV